MHITAGPGKAVVQFAVRLKSPQQVGKKLT